MLNSAFAKICETQEIDNFSTNFQKGLDIYFSMWHGIDKLNARKNPI